MSSFSVSMKAWCDKATNNMHQVVRDTVGGIVIKVDARSPVGDRELWAINQVRAMNIQMYQEFAADSGKPASYRTAASKFEGLKPKGYVGGRFRANWQLGMDSQPDGELFVKSPPTVSFQSGAETVANNLAVISPLAGGHMYYLVNNLPYAQALENGHSTQCPPGGMVGLTVQEFQQIVDAAVAGLDK